MVRLLAVAALLALTWVAPPAQAQADESRTQARALFSRGVEEFQAGDAQSALVSFEAAYRLAPHPAVRVNMANCHEALGHIVEAVFNYQRFLDESDAKANPAQRAEVEATIARLSKRIGTLTLEVQPPDAAVRIDGEAPKSSPTGAVQLPAGSYTLGVSAEGYQASERSVVIAGGEEVRLVVKLAPDTERVRPAAVALPAPRAPSAVRSEAAPSDRAGPEPGFWAQPRVFWTAAGTAAACAVGVAVTGALALSAEHDFDAAARASEDPANSRDARQAAVDDGNAAADRADRLALASDLLLAGSIATGGAALWWWLAHGRPWGRSTTAGPTAFGRHGAGLMLGGQF